MEEVVEQEQEWGVGERACARREGKEIQVRFGGA